VLLADGAADARSTLRAALEACGDFEVVAEAATGAEAVRLGAEHQPHVVLLDAGLPGLAGRDILTRTRKGAPHAQVIVLSDRDPAGCSWRTTTRSDSRDEAGPDGDSTSPADGARLVELLASVGRSQCEEATDDFAHERVSVSAARRFVRRQVEQWHVGTVHDEASLVVTELAANAVDHARSSFHVHLVLTHAALRIEVRDRGTGTPEPQTIGRSQERGRGLHLVSALATSWGVEDARGGKVVWAELALPRPA
jgi:DNA-binding NarL/FixJ family response regulator